MASLANIAQGLTGGGGGGARDATTPVRRSSLKQADEALLTKAAHQAFAVARAAVKHVKRHPKTGQEITNEWQRDTDILYYLSAGNISRLKDEFDAKAHSTGEGLTLAEFVYVMLKCLGAFIVNQVDFVVQAIDLFRQVDVNGDGTMDWDEFTSYIVEAGLAQGKDVASTQPTVFRYKFVNGKDPTIHHTYVTRLMAFPKPLDCIASMEHRSEMLRMFHPAIHRETPVLQQTKSVRHDTAYSPHSVLACHVIPELGMLATSSQLAPTGPYHLSFWDTKKLNLINRITTDTPQGVCTRFGCLPVIHMWQQSICWSHRAQLLFTAGGGVGAGTASPIIGWDLRTYTKVRSLMAQVSSVTDMVEIPGNVASFLISASMDGTLMPWDMRKFVPRTDLTLVAHEGGVRGLVFSQQLERLASWGYPDAEANATMSSNAVCIWHTTSWLEPAVKQAGQDEPGADIETLQSDIPEGAESPEPEGETMSVTSDAKSTVLMPGFRPNLPRPVLLVGHTDPVIAVTFQDAPGLKGPPHVVTGDIKGCVRVWDAHTWHCYQVIQVTHVPSLVKRRPVRTMTAEQQLVANRRRRKELRAKEKAQAKAAKALARGVTVRSVQLPQDGAGAPEDVVQDVLEEAMRVFRATTSAARQSATSIDDDEDNEDEESVASDPDAEAAEAEAQSAAAASATAVRSSDFTRLDSLLALPPSDLETEQASVVLAGNQFRFLLLTQIIEPPLPLIAALFNATSFTFVTATAARLTVWDAITGRGLRSYDAATICEGALISAMCLDGRRRKIIIGDSSGRIRVLNFLNCALIKELDPHLQQVASLAYSAEDSCLISGGWDSCIHVCDESAKDGFSVLPVHRSVLLRRGKIPALDGLHELVARERSRSISEFWVTAAGETQDELSVEEDDNIADKAVTKHGTSTVDVTLVALGPHLNLMATAARGMNDSNAVLFWRYDKSMLKGGCAYLPDGSSIAEIAAMTFLEPYPAFVAATADGQFFLWAVPPHPLACALLARWTNVPNCTGAPISMCLAHTSTSPKLKLWSAPASAPRIVQGCYTDASPGFLLVSGDESGLVHMWELTDAFLGNLGLQPVPRQPRSNAVERRLGRSMIPRHLLAQVLAASSTNRKTRAVQAVCGAYFGGDRAVAATISNQLPVWAGSWKAHSDSVTSLSWMEESCTVLSGSADGMARVWSCDGMCLGTLDPNPKHQPEPPVPVEELARRVAETIAGDEAPVTQRGSARATERSERTEPTARPLPSPQPGSMTARTAAKAAQPIRVPVPESRSLIQAAVTRLDFVNGLPEPPMIGPVVWTLKFDLAARRRRDEAEARQIIPTAKLLKVTHRWRDKINARQEARRQQAEETLAVLADAGFTADAHPEDDAAAAGSSLHQGSSTVHDNDDAESQASVLIASQELMEHHQQTGLSGDKVTDQLLTILAGLSTMDSEDPVQAQQDTNDVYTTLLRSASTRFSPHHLLDGNMQSSVFSASRKSHQGLDPSGNISEQPSVSSFVSHSTPPRSGTVSHHHSMVDDAMSQASAASGQTNAFLESYTAQGKRVGSLRRVRPDQVAPKHLLPYTHLIQCRSLVPPTAMPAVRSSTKSRQRTKPLVSEVLSTSISALDGKLSEQEVVAQAIQNVRRGSNVSTASRHLSDGLPPKPTTLQPLPSRESLGRVSAQNSVMSQSNPLRPGLVKFDSNPNTPMDAGGTHYPKILSRVTGPGHPSLSPPKSRPATSNNPSNTKSAPNLSTSSSTGSAPTLSRFGRTIVT